MTAGRRRGGVGGGPASRQRSSRSSIRRGYLCLLRLCFRVVREFDLSLQPERCVFTVPAFQKMLEDSFWLPSWNIAADSLSTAGHRLLFSRPSLRCKEKAIIPGAQIKRRGDAEPVTARRQVRAGGPAGLAVFAVGCVRPQERLRGSEAAGRVGITLPPSGRGALVPRLCLGTPSWKLRSCL